jgi:predicted SAM-dependent methyltransferase
MSTIEKPGELATQLDPLPVYLDARAAFANSYLLGEGLEIGPLHQPLAIPAHARARYVDRMTATDLRREYPELTEWDLTEVDIVDDGETLSSIQPESQDFIVANHVLEHTENPIGTIETHFSKLKPGGVLFYAVPDKRFTFDYRRPVTPIEHMIADYEEGPERSRAEHYEEWCRLVMSEVEHADVTREQASSEEWVQMRARQLEDAKYSIHMHVWTQAEFLKLVLAMRERLEVGFDLEAAARVGIEFIVVLRKDGPLPLPPSAGAPPSRREVWESRAKRLMATGRDKVRRRRSRP